MKKIIKKSLLTGILAWMLIFAAAGCASKTKDFAAEHNICDPTQLTKVDLAMGDTGMIMSFPLRGLHADGLHTYAELSIPTDIDEYEYKNGSTEIKLKSKKGYEVSIDAYNYTSASSTPQVFVDDKKKSADATAQKGDGRATIAKDKSGTCVIVMTYDRYTEIYVYLYNNTALVKYLVKYDSDQSQSTVSEAKTFVKKLSGAEL